MREIVASQAELSLPREAWSDHPRYPRQTLLLRSHESFRLFSQTLVARSKTGTTHAALNGLFRQLMGSMRGHEGYEEHKLYPYLEHRWGLDLMPLRVDHQHLHDMEDDVYNALSGHGSVHDALLAHSQELDDHLDREEQLVIPALLALHPIEFDRYYRGHIGELLDDTGR
ncbi:MAG: hypothetical protein ACI9MC_002025 [Kiritimatiellia bacterium]|jgi:hypothetical protein